MAEDTSGAHERRDAFPPVLVALRKTLAVVVSLEMRCVKIISSESFRR